MFSGQASVSSSFGGKRNDDCRGVNALRGMRRDHTKECEPVSDTERSRNLKQTKTPRRKRRISNLAFFVPGKLV